MELEGWTWPAGLTSGSSAPIGSGGQTAHAVFRTLGRSRLAELEESKALMALLRILRTSVNVEMWGVSEPLCVHVVMADKRVRGVSEDELQAHLQAIDKWEEDDRQRFFWSKI